MVNCWLFSQIVDQSPLPIPNPILLILHSQAIPLNPQNLTLSSITFFLFAKCKIPKREKRWRRWTCRFFVELWSNGNYCVCRTRCFIITIADVNLLLPPKMTFHVEYRLQGSGCCFKWSWDHHDILSILPEYNSSHKCSTSARLRSIAPYSGRKEIVVYATNVKTGIVIRCKVFIDNISRI